MEQQGQIERKETYTVVTTEPNAFTAQIHDRMPLVLEMDDIEAWMSSSPDAAAAKLIRPAKEGVLQERRLGRAINNVKNTGRSC